MFWRSKCKWWSNSPSFGWMPSDDSLLINWFTYDFRQYLYATYVSCLGLGTGSSIRLKKCLYKTAIQNICLSTFSHESTSNPYNNLFNSLKVVSFNFEKANSTSYVLQDCLSEKYLVITHKKSKLKILYKLCLSKKEVFRKLCPIGSRPWHEPVFLSRVSGVSLCMMGHLWGQIMEIGLIPVALFCYLRGEWVKSSSPFFSGQNWQLS